MMSKEYTCPVCNQDNLGNMFLHIALNPDEKHIELLDPIIDYTNTVAGTKYAFEIAEHIVANKTDVGIYLLSKDINSLTSFISRVIVLLGYNRRKCVSMQRKTIALSNYRSDSLALKDKIDILKRSIPRKIKNLVPNSFIPVGENKQDNNEHKVEITKIFSFAAGHHLPNHPRLCQYSHGHEWKLEVSVYDKVDSSTNMVLDFSDLKKIVNFNIIEILDHNYINDIVYNPTAENLCAWIFEELYSSGLHCISKIKLWEAEDSFAVLKRRDFFNTTHFVL